MRRIMVTGNLTADAEVKPVGGRFAINFACAVNEKHKAENGEKIEKTTFFNCVIWRESNVNVAEYLTKGTKVLLEGTPEPELFKNKDGEHKVAIKIIVTNLEIQGGGTPKNAQEKTPTPNPASGKKDNKSDDLPF